MDRQYLSSDDDNDNESIEVSLPGVGDNEQPTILEVLNRGIVSTEEANANANGNGNVKASGTDTEAKIEGGPTREIEKRIIGDTVNTIKVTSTLEDDALKKQQEPQQPLKHDKEESDNLVSSSSSSRRKVEWQKPQRSLAEDEENVFDIESHLIETLNNYSVSEDSESWGVDIKELPPAEGESLDRTSKIETDPLIGTVIEVEPATPKVLKPIETSVPDSGVARNAQVEQISVEVELDKADVSVVDEELELEIPLESTKPIWTIVKEVQKQLDVEKTNRAKTTAQPQTDRAEDIELKEDPVDRGNPISKNRPSDEDPVEKKPVQPDEKPTATDAQENKTVSECVSQIEKEELIEISEEQAAHIPEDQSRPNSTSVSPTEVKLEAEEADLSSPQTVVPKTDSEVEPNRTAEGDKKPATIQVETASSPDKKSTEIKGQPGSEGTGISEVKELTKDLETEIEISEQPEQPEIRESFKEQATSISVDQVDHSVSIEDPLESKLITKQQTAAPSKELSESTQEHDSGIYSVSSADEKFTTTQSEVKPDSTQNPASAEEEETNAQTTSLDKENLPFNPFAAVKVFREIGEVDDSGGGNAESIQSLNTTKTEIESTAPDPQVAVKDDLPNDTINDGTKTDLQVEKLESRTPSTEESTALSKEIDQKLSELTTHLTKSSNVDLNGNIPKDSAHLETNGETGVDVNGLPLPKTAQEEEQRQQFLDSLPQISPESDSNKVAALAKREYYQSLRQYLINHSDKPPIPPETYRWEDLRRAKNRGGYPWTHLYKRPLGPDEEPEIVLLLRKSQELRFSESPKSFKKVRIDDQVSIKETERYIQELSDTEDNPPTEDEKDDQEDAQSECISCVSDSVLTCEKRASKLGKIRGILKKRSPRKEADARSLPDTSSAPRPSLSTEHRSEEDIHERVSRRKAKEGPSKAKCFPIMKKLRSMADRQKKNFQNIRKISLKKDEKITLEEEQKIIKLKTSPKAVRSEIPHFIEKQDSDDVLEIVELDESPSRKRKDQLELQEQAAAAISAGSVVVPDEIIEIPTRLEHDPADRQQTPEPTVSEILEEELKSEAAAAPPKKTARLRREHVYEDIEAQNGEAFGDEIDNILEIASVEALKYSLTRQDASTLNDVEATKTALPLERMGSSEEEVERSHLAPISSIDSASSEEERKQHLSTVAEESDDGATGDKEVTTKLKTVPEVVPEPSEHIPWNDIELKPALKKEPSPSPSDKKVTFSHVEDEAEPHREDIELPEGLSGIGSKRWSNLSDHEYEPIGQPAKEPQETTVESQPMPAIEREPSPAPVQSSAPVTTPTAAPAAAPLQELPKLEIQQPSPDATSEEASPSPQPDELQQVEELQRKIEDRYFSSAATTPHTDSQADYDVHTSQVDSSALEELPLKPESRKKGFMASAQDRTRKMQAGLRTQAGKIKTKFRSPKKAPSGSPKAKERKRFKAPEFSKIKMPEMKRPEFTKFSKPDMSKFKLPDKFSSLKLTRSKSFKEPTEVEDTTVSGTTPEESTSPATAAQPKKSKFDFSFGTYPRAFKKKKKPVEVESTVETPSVLPSTETQPSVESSSTPQGDRGPGPVRSRWADKFSDVSYNDSEGSRYRRYGSEQESSFDRESSMERRMKEVLEENAKEEAELAMLSVVEQKEFAEYDEENRVIHEISKTREGEFKRRPMVHQDSDLISEEGRDIGWTQREAEKNRILRKSELEAEEHLRYLTERMSNQDTHSTASSKKLVFEEINDDEFLLRKKGISQEFNITQHTKYIDPRLQESYDNSPNGMEIIGGRHGSSVDRMDFGYDVPPPKPRRLSQQQRRRYYDSENASQVEEYPDDISYSQAGSDYMKEGPPSRPLRKGRFKNSQEISVGGTPSVQFEDDEKENITGTSVPPPQVPRRRRKQQRESLEKDSYINGFGGRSVSNSYLKEDNKPDEVIVYRTEHKYKIPLATTEKSSTEPSAPPRKSRSLSRLGMDDDDRTSRGVDSINVYNDNRDAEDEKYIIEMMENDGYAVVRKENLPKPTPPARRKKFSRSPGERFATMPHMRKGGSPAVGLEQKPYSTIGRPTPPRRKSALSLGAGSQKDFGSADFDDYEVPEFADRTDSPRNLQSGDIINKMKYRPLPPPPRPPREKRSTPRDRHGDDDDEFDSRDDRDDRDDRDGGGEQTVFQDFHEISSDDYNQEDHLDKSIEVEVSTQTDPLPDDFVCEEFEITDDMKIIEPRRTKTLDEILKEEEEAELERARQIDEEFLLRGIQRFREANQRSVSEKSRASSQAKSLSRPQTPSAILIEKRIPTPVPNANGQTVLEASLTVQPIDDLDLEEELLRREGLYDGSHSKSDADSRYQEEEAHASEEENEMVGEEDRDARSYTTDAEVHRSVDDDMEQQRLRLEELRLEEERLEEERLEEERLEKERMEVQRLEEASLEEQRIEEQLLEEQRLLEQRLREEEEEEQRLLEQLEKEEKEQKLLEQEQLTKFASETKERPEEEDLNKRLLDLEIQKRLLLSSWQESHGESVEQNKLGDSHEEEPELDQRSPSPTQANEEAITASAKILPSQSDPLERPAETRDELPATSSPPLAPPRKRSYAAPASDDQPESMEEKPSAEPVPFTGLAQSHLALADLEVERLRVHALQAGQIMVSHLHGGQIQAEELECRSGNLVVRNIELPIGFIEDIVERVRSTEREHTQTGTQTIAEMKTQTDDDSIPPPPIPMRQSDIPPVRPPPPHREAVFPTEFMHDIDEAAILPRSVHPTEYPHGGPPIGFYRPPDDGLDPIPPVYRRRRHHRRRDSSSEEEQQPRRSRSARPETQSVGQAGRQFISACSLPLINAINQLTNAIRPNNDNKQDQVQPRNISAVIVLFVVMTLSFLIYLLTGRNIHHHHWDYFNPPGNDGRLS